MDFLDLIKTQVAESIKGQVELPKEKESSVLGGISDAILGGLKQSAGETNGLENITSLFSGKTAASSSPVTQMIQSFFVQNIAPKLGLSSSLASTVQAFLPTIIEALTKKTASDGGLDIASVISSLAGGESSGGSLLDKASGLLGGLFGK
ncbi:DUF937 domain-containing protein [Massilibacteroides sp.]|uniref:DUF937 domain-containing protein n=1 Tax=Massilibacteroides sp. TaxID=2034766 RepID=UPI00262A3990|nr:DUF937 domain-containing protein [Massilibacteroides sp.]MDD4514816.1 DUF937 domain-containing protein [Massilibacteroides sp.]